MDPSNVSASTGQAAARAYTAAGRGALPWRVDLLAWWAAFEGHRVGAVHALAPALERLRAYAQRREHGRRREGTIRDGRLDGNRHDRGRTQPAYVQY